MKIFTHQRTDLDALASCWAARRFIPEARDALVEFVPANWDGQGFGRKPQDLLLDLSAGIKGDMIDGRRHSCFALLMQRYAPEEAREAMRNITAYIDAADSSGNAYKTLAPQITLEQARLFSHSSLVSVVEALRTADATDQQLLDLVCLLFDGFLKRETDALYAKKLARDPNVVRRHVSKSGLIVCQIMRERKLNAALFEDDPLVAFVIYRSKGGREFGVNRADTMPHLVIASPEVQGLVTVAREEWFDHPNGFLFCWGTSKAPKDKPSRVHPDELAKALVAYLDRTMPVPAPPTTTTLVVGVFVCKTGYREIFGSARYVSTTSRHASSRAGAKETHPSIERCRGSHRGTTVPRPRLVAVHQSGKRNRCPKNSN